MADKQERKIPIFTVLKNNNVLKNIFLTDKPPPILHNSNFELIDESIGNNSTNQEDDEVLVVGRHPDCNVVLGHPSISRFHLRIHTKPSLQKLCIVDLSSIHGTWVSGKKIEPEVKVELNEGDTIKIGGSTRVYRLHWIPTSNAYDFENLFGKSLPLSDADKEDDMNQSFKNEEILSLDSIMGDLDCIHFNENFDSLVKQPSPSAPLMPELLDFCPGSVVSDTVNLSMSDQRFLPRTSNIQFGERSKIEGELNFPTDKEDAENKSPMGKDHSHRSALIVPESVNSSLTTGAIPPRSENQRFNEKGSPKCLFETGLFERNENLEESPTPTLRSKQKSGVPSIWSRRGKVTSVQIQSGKNKGKSTTKRNSEIRLQSQNDKNFSTSKVLFPPEKEEMEEELFTPDKENLTPNYLLMRSLKKDKDFSTSKVLFPIDKEEEEEEEEELFTPDKENLTPDTLLMKSLKKKATTEEIGGSNILGSGLMKSFKRCTHLEDDMVDLRDRENQTPKVLQEQKLIKPLNAKGLRLELDTPAAKREKKQMPFQPINSSGKSKREASLPCTAIGNGISNSVDSGQMIRLEDRSSGSKNVGQKKMMWYLVVDTSTLINKESMKSLQLLQGVRGTQLIIPRTVVRELDFLNRRGSVFSRNSAIPLALEWIEESMVKAKWWIHVQSSTEEGRPLAPTPPVSPRSRYGDGGGFFGGSESSIPSPTWGGSLLEILTPTTEDHILECALHYRRIKNDGQLVLFANDVTLKIKAMAEGLQCETAEEFRNSLMNPFSERFLWADSSPRGATWTCLDDVVLREKFYHRPSKKNTKAGASAKGLKLILLHNAQSKYIRN